MWKCDDNSETLVSSLCSLPFCSGSASKSVFLIPIFLLVAKVPMMSSNCLKMGSFLHRQHVNFSKFYWGTHAWTQLIFFWWFFQASDGTVSCTDSSHPWVNEPHTTTLLRFWGILLLFNLDLSSIRSFLYIVFVCMIDRKSTRLNSSHRR